VGITLQGFKPGMPGFWEKYVREKCICEILIRDKLILLAFFVFIFSMLKSLGLA